MNVVLVVTVIAIVKDALEGSITYEWWHVGGCGERTLVGVKRDGGCSGGSRVCITHMWRTPSTAVHVCYCGSYRMSSSCDEVVVCGSAAVWDERQ